MHPAPYIRTVHLLIVMLRCCVQSSSGAWCLVFNAQQAHGGLVAQLKGQLCLLFKIPLCGLHAASCAHCFVCTALTCSQGAVTAHSAHTGTPCTFERAVTAPHQAHHTHCECAHQAHHAHPFAAPAPTVKGAASAPGSLTPNDLEEIIFSLRIFLKN